MNGQNSSIYGFLSLLGRRKRVAFTIFAAIFSVSLIGTLAATPIYQGSVQIIIERIEQDNLTGQNKTQPKDPEFEKTQFQLIRSHAVATRVVKTLEHEEAFKAKNLYDLGMFNSIVSKLKNWLKVLVGHLTSGKESSDVKEQINLESTDAVAKEVSKNIRVRPVQGSDITEITYLSPNPQLAALVANTYVDAYLEEVLEMKMDATRRNLEWMTQKAEAERLKLQVTERRLQEYMESKNLITLENKVTILPEKLTQLGRELVKYETMTKEYKLLYEKVQRVADDLNAAESVLSISEGNSLDVLRAQILKAEQNIMELSSKYGSKHPVMIKAQGDLKVLRQKRHQEINRIIAKVRGQYELALSNENSIRAQLNETKAEALELNEKYLEYNVLKGEVETNKQLYDALLTKIKNQSITGESRPVNLWVVNEAKIPPKPVRPMVTLNLLLGFVLGLCCGIGGAVLTERIDNRVKSSEGLGETLGTPVLGSVTYNKNNEAMREVSRTDPRSEFAESYNSLRTVLLLSAAEAPPNRILVTSSIAGEGKTTTSVNLALTMAKSGSRTLLIDADLRKPVVHKIFKIGNSMGLSSYLTGNLDGTILKKSTHENLAVIPSGPIPPNPYELLNSKRMKELLKKLEDEFDFIICDSPPILSVADSRALSKEMSGLILVARSGETTYPMLANSIQMLNDVNAKILGVFVNAVHPKDQTYYQYYSSYIEGAAKQSLPQQKDPLTP